jgi:hypothetical protein
MHWWSRPLPSSECVVACSRSDSLFSTVGFVVVVIVAWIKPFSNGSKINVLRFGKAATAAAYWYGTLSRYKLADIPSTFWAASRREPCILALSALLLSYRYAVLE